MRSQDSGKVALELLGHMRFALWAAACNPRKQAGFVGRVGCHLALGPVQQMHILGRAGGNVLAVVNDGCVTNWPGVCAGCHFAQKPKDESAWHKDVARLEDQANDFLFPASDKACSSLVPFCPVPLNHPHLPIHCFLNQRAMAGPLLTLGWLESLVELHRLSSSWHHSSLAVEAGEHQEGTIAEADAVESPQLTPAQIQEDLTQLTILNYSTVDSLPEYCQGYMKHSMAEVDSDEEDAHMMVDKTLLLFQGLHGFGILDELEHMQEIWGRDDKKEHVSQREQDWLLERAREATFAERLMDAWWRMLEDSKDVAFSNAWASISGRHQAHLDKLLKQMSARHAREIASASVAAREGPSDTSSSSSSGTSSHAVCLSLLDCKGENLNVGEALGPNALYFMAHGFERLSKEEKELWAKARDHQRDVRSLQQLAATHEQQEAGQNLCHKLALASKAVRERKAVIAKAIQDGRRELGVKQSRLLNEASHLQKNLHIQLVSRLEGFKLSGSKAKSLSPRFQGVDDLD